MKLEKKHYWMIGIGVTLATVGIVLVVRNKKQKAEALALESNNPNKKRVVEYAEHQEASSSEEAAEVEGAENIFPLQFGSENQSVSDLQRYMNSTSPSELKKAGVFPLIIDGVWKDKTETASLACMALKRNKIDRESFERISRDLLSANIK
jgi:hypothetical protein